MREDYHIHGLTGWLSKLRRDKRGNTLAMMAIFLFPLAGLVGSAVDMGRLYLTKVRLQAACDAGVLAGRKFMNGTGATLDANAIAQANTFFANNFSSGFMGTPAFTATTSPYPFTATKTDDGQVSGKASIPVPMTIMKMFGSPTISLDVTCEARFDVTDTDVMFVLDTTGSMACAPTNPGCATTTKSYVRPDTTTGYYTVEQSGSKIAGLRSAVLSFYDTMATSIDPTTHLRYGFVTYTSTVNVGYSLPQDTLVKTWSYQSRKIDQNTPTSGGKPNWNYNKISYDVSKFITGAYVTDPSKQTGVLSKWQGCVEERDTTVSSSFDFNNLPADLDPDLPATTDGTRWRPMWPDVTYYRGNVTGGVTISGNSKTVPGDLDYSTKPAATTAYTNLIVNPNVFWDTNISSGYVSCGKPVQLLAEMSRSDVSDYVNASDFRAIGGTYHDTGMIWGTRLISPTGLFKSYTAAWPNRPDPKRYIVFMTDGEMAPNYDLYGMYGIERYDKRVTGGNSAVQTAYHNARFVAVCNAAKARNISVFVIGFGQTLNDQLIACASPGQAYYASDNDKLTAAFQKIAKQIAQLRLSQ